ncbi:hypothetical protein [Planctomycetes bacterium K23_9]|uniref:DUF4760 domain-containing protein n=1 Tax=Stieleria marina TaxID=1930275 RepID=A0A517NW20_9BACT|nr:hypothetical protein K239x_33160 [Planctomycetes bacterium K23_9]
MKFDEWILVGQLVATAFTGAAGAILALAVYRLTSRQREDAWDHHFASIHHSFWDDPDYQQVREWVASPKSYVELSEVLAKRRSAEAQQQLTSDEYKKLDQLDKFLNLLARVVALNRKKGGKNDGLVNALFFVYWAKRVTDSSSMGSEDANQYDDLYWYVETYYREFWSYFQSQAKSVT